MYILRIIYMEDFQKSLEMKLPPLPRKQKKKKNAFGKSNCRANLIMNRYPIANIARLDALRTKKNNSQKY